MNGSQTGDAAIGHTDLFSNPLAALGISAGHTATLHTERLKQTSSCAARLASSCLSVMERLGLCIRPRIISAACIVCDASRQGDDAAAEPA